MISALRYNPPPYWSYKMVNIWTIPPEGFRPDCEVAACYLEVERKLLLLEHNPYKINANKWGVPAGKIDPNEPPFDAALRELFEETGIVASPSQVHELGKLYISKHDVAYIYHIFQVDLESMPEVQLSSEHTRYSWTLFEQIPALPLIAGALEALDFYLRQKK